jgi:hypothetical protein
MSSSMEAIPPKMNKVMFFTVSPEVWATSAWASSCTRTHTNKSRAEMSLRKRVAAEDI